jgi:hypothetical protein
MRAMMRSSAASPKLPGVGMGQAKIDLNKAYLTRTIGDLVAVYSWVNDERALVLIPAYRKNSAWYIILDSAAFKYDDDEYLKRQSMVAAEVLGMEPSPNNWYKLAKVIVEGLPDLLEMPSAPTDKILMPTLGEARMYANGELVGGDEIRLEKEEGMSYEH